MNAQGKGKDRAVPSAGQPASARFAVLGHRLSSSKMTAIPCACGRPAAVAIAKALVAHARR